MSLRQKTISGITWSFFDNSINQISQLVIGIILARLLSPEDFGLIGMILIFIGISQALTEAGFRQSLVRKINCSEQDYNTIFFTSITISLFLYAFLFLMAPYISVFFNEPRLIGVLRIISLYIIIDAIGNVHGAILIKNINYKLRSKITFFATTISGIFAIIFAILGFEVWSLVLKQLFQGFIFITLLWFWTDWKPKFLFSFQHLGEHLRFGMPILGSNLLETVFNYLYYVIIGKFYSTKELGYYTRAITFSSLPSNGLNDVIDRVTFPILSNFQNDDEELKSKVKFTIKHITLVTFFLTALVSAAAHSIVVVLIGNKWLPIVLYIKLLCLVFILNPIIATNINILKIKGLTSNFLKIEFIRKIFAIPIIFLAIRYNIIILIFGLIIHSIFSWILYAYIIAKILRYNILEQIKDIFPAAIVSVIIFISLSLLALINLSDIILLVTQIILALVIFYIFTKIFKIGLFNEIINLVIIKIKSY